MKNQHEPDPNFRGHLEWQVASEARRRERFGSAAPIVEARGRGRGPALLRAASILLVGLTIGMSATVLAAQLERSEQREVRLAPVTIEIELAKTELELLEREKLRVAQLYERGLVNTSAMQSAEINLTVARAAKEQLELDAAEIRASSHAPDRRLSAALVGGRDFVTESLQVALVAAVQRLVFANESAERTEALHARGFVSSAELEKGRMAALGVTEDERRVRAQLELRRRFIAKELTSVQLSLADRLDQARATARKCSAELQFIESQARRHEQLVEAGVSASGSGPVLDLARSRAKTELAQLRLERLLEECSGLPEDLMKGLDSRPESGAVGGTVKNETRSGASKGK